MAKKQSEAKKARKRPRKVVEYAMAKRAISQHGDELLALQGVTGISVGPRFRKDKPVRDEMTIRLHVSTEEEKQQLKNNADELGLRKQYGGIGIDIVVWNFKPAFDLDDVADGDGMSGQGGQGTLGTRVITRVDGIRTVVWLTAAHVAAPARPPQGRAVVISIGGQRIGTVSADDYFRDDGGDAAFVVPDGAKLTPHPRRRVRHLFGDELGRIVTKTGAATGATKGEIISLFFVGKVTDDSGNEDDVTDHFLVRHTDSSTDFARRGDSGAMVKLDGDLVGILRGVDAAERITVVSKLDIVRKNAGLLGRRFDP